MRHGLCPVPFLWTGAGTSGAGAALGVTGAGGCYSITLKALPSLSAGTLRDSDRLESKRIGAGGVAAGTAEHV